MPTPEAVNAAVAASLDTWKRQLLDLTRRNRALNFRPLKVSTVAVVGEPPAEIYRLIHREEASMTFAAAPPAAGEPESQSSAGIDDDAFAFEEHLVSGATFEPYSAQTLAATHIDRVLQTALDAEALDRSLRRIEEQARVSIEEQGVNTLFLTLGLLHYTEADASDQVLRAPLVLLPVSLRRESARAPFVVEAADDDPMVNPALSELLRRQFNLVLPDLPADEPAGDAPPPSLQDFFLEVQSRLTGLPIAAATPSWRVTDDVYLGLFSFQKIVMYKDLEANADAVLGHRLVTQLVTRRGSVTGGSLGLPDDVRQARLDEDYPPELGTQVVDADGSQQRALAAADRGYDLVVEGPPGTGKSQTITNLVAQALHAGKSVLFVAEKMAALGVVYERLRQVGLGEFCLELHSTHSSRREVIRSVAAALDASLEPVAAREGCGDKLRDVRTALGTYVAALHEPFGALQATPYGAYGELARVIDAPRVDLAFDAEPVTRPALERAQAALEALAAAAGAAGDVATHPWRDTGRTFYPQDRLDAVVEAAADVARRVPVVAAASAEATARLGLPPLASTADLDRVLGVADLLRRSPGVPRTVLENPEWDAGAAAVASLIVAVTELRRLEGDVSSRFTSSVLADDHTEDIAYMEARSGPIGTLFWWLDARQRAIRKRWLTYRQPSYRVSFAEQAHDLGAVAALRAARAGVEARESIGRSLFGPLWQGAGSDPARLEACAEWVVEFRAALSRESLPDTALTVAANGSPDLSLVTRLEQEVRSLQQAVDALGHLVEWRHDRPLSALPLAELAGRASGLVSHAHLAARWGAFVAASQDVEQTIAASMPGAVSNGRATWAELPSSFLRAFWFAWLGRAVEARPALARFQALTHDQRVREFQDLDRRVLEDNRARLVASLRERVQARLREPAADAAMPLLRREMAKQRNHRPIRETLRHADAAVRAIKPVFLMSPLSVAQFTRGDAPTFDLVIFDEASQLPPEDAVGAVVRGQQLVVVGDPRQLPPTSFFAARDEVTAAVDDPDGLEVPDAESILEAFMGSGMPMSRLKWHYRSAHESLIAFSNVSFYDGDLLTFPSVEPISDHLGLRFEHVAGAVYEGKGLNLAEARRVADEVVAFARQQLAAEAGGRRPQSLGVGTFNLRQQLAIQDLLEERRRADPAIEPFFDRSRREPFFVKNLENIQGDERDVIFLSVTYAKGRDGRLRQNFGPLNGDNGWRRLNVLTTRARRAMRVFSSMRAGDLQVGQSKGGPLLKAFLEFAESGRLDHPAVTVAAATQSPFEREVVNELTRRGHLVESQVGVAGYRIDIGVRDPDAPGRFLVGIECDGVAYHSSETARDRDRLRQQVLEARGWTIVRLWSTDWFKDRAGQMERLERAIAEAVNKGEGKREQSEGLQGTREERDQGRREEGDGPESGMGPMGAAEPTRPTATAAGADLQVHAYVKAAAPTPLRGTGVLECDLDTLAALVTRVVATESPVHEDDLAARVAGFWGQRVGARIRAHVLAAARASVARGHVETRGDFLWTPGAGCVARDRSGTGIGADRIAPEEYEAAVRVVLQGGRIVRRDALLTEARRRLGFERTGSTLAEALAGAVDRLLARGVIGEGSEGYRLR